MDNTVFSVSEFVALVNQTLEYAYPQVTIEGEVSSFKVSKDKYVFFDLKDNESTVNCFMTVWQLKIPVEDGMKVRVVAQPKLTQWGRFSLTVQTVSPVGEGSLKKAYELLKAKLTKEGLFDEARKRTLPVYPERIGVISSAQAAGYADFIKIVNARWGGVTIEFADVQVQGDVAPDQIVQAIDYFNQQADTPDLIVILRGGGSLDDLQAFNTEPVVRAIAGSRAPTVVGVGHETDTTLADLAADVRAATPSNAAQLIVPDKKEIEHLLNLKHQQLLAGFERPVRYVDELARRWAEQGVNVLERLNQRVDTFEQLLNSYNPKSVLQRGYGIARDANGKIIRQAAAVRAGERVVIELQRGKLDTEVIRVQK